MCGEIMRDTQTFENHAQTAVEIGNNSERKCASKRFQNISTSRVKFPNTSLPQNVRRRLRRNVVAIEFARLRRDLLENSIDQCAPPAFVVILPRPRSHAEPGMFFHTSRKARSSASQSNERPMRSPT